MSGLCDGVVTATVSTLAVYGRCPQCGTWTLVTNHPEDECRRWVARRSDPSHEHTWVLIGEAAVACEGSDGCRLLGEVKFPALPAPGIRAALPASEPTP